MPQIKAQINVQDAPQTEIKGWIKDLNSSPGVVLLFMRSFCSQEPQHAARCGRHRPAGGLLAGFSRRQAAGGRATRHGLQEHTEERLPLAAGQQATRRGQQRPTSPGQHNGHDRGHQGKEQKGWADVPVVCFKVRLKKKKSEPRLKHF